MAEAQRQLRRLPYRQKWDRDFRAYLLHLEKTKPVVFCGDLNVAHQEIDLAHPKANRLNAGPCSGNIRRGRAFQTFEFLLKAHERRPAGLSIPRLGRLLQRAGGLTEGSGAQIPGPPLDRMCLLPQD